MANKDRIKLYNDTEEIIFYPDSHRYRKPGQKNYLISVSSVTNIISPYGKIKGLQQWAVNQGCDYMEEYLDHHVGGDMLSVEEVRGLIADARYRHKEDLEKEASLGDEVHAFAEEFARRKAEGEEMTDDMLEFDDDRALALANDFLDWVDEHDVTFLEAERVVYSKNKNYVGTMDVLAEIDGDIYVVDYKTSSGIFTGHKIQVAGGYHQAWNEEVQWLIKNEEDDGFYPADNAMIVRFDKDGGDFEVWKADRQVGMYERIFNNGLGVKKDLKELNRQS